MIKEWLISVIFMMLIYYCMIELLNAIHPSLARTLKSLVKISFKLIIYWPIKLIIKGIKNFLHPPLDQIHPEPPPHFKA